MFKFPKRYNPFYSLSDHMPQVYDTGKFGSVLTWNILVKCEFHQNRNYYNNGFAHTESEEEYRIRLKKIAQKISSIVKENNNINIIALQEIPKDDKNFDYFQEMLRLELSKKAPNKNFYINDDNMNRPRGLFVVYDSNLLSGQNITSIQNISNLYLEKQKDKHQYFEFSDNQSNIIRLFNVHFEWFPPFSGDFYSSVSDIKTLIEFDRNYQDKPHELLLCGDFNLDLSSTDLNQYYQIQLDKKTTLAYKFDRQMQILDTSDGFIHVIPDIT